MLSTLAFAMAIYTLGPLIGPAVGPVAGGFLAQTVGFRWIFIVIAVASAIGGVCGILVLKETYAPVIQIRRAKKHLKQGGEKTIDHEVLLDERRDFGEVMWINMTRPFVLLFRSPICFILSLYMGM